MNNLQAAELAKWVVVDRRRKRQPKGKDGPPKASQKGSPSKQQGDQYETEVAEAFGLDTVGDGKAG